MKLRTISPAPLSRTSESAISATTSTRPVRAERCAARAPAGVVQRFPVIGARQLQRGRHAEDDPGRHRREAS